MKQELYSIDSKKWDMLLDLLERPESYSETQKAELLGDEEMNEIYQQMVETRQAFDFDKSNEEMKMPSVDAEWKKLKEEKQNCTKAVSLWSPMRKVAAVAAVLVSQASPLQPFIWLCFLVRHQTRTIPNSLQQARILCWRFLSLGKLT